MALNPELGTKLVVLLGISNVFFLLLVFFSCRCRLGNKLGDWLWKYSWYQKFYNYHCYYWWAFVASVALHATLALLTFGFPWF